MLTSEPLRVIEYFDQKEYGNYAYYNPKGKFPFLQRLCFFILRKLGCAAVYTLPIQNVTVLDTEDLIKLVLESAEMTSLLSNKRGKYLVVGRDYYERLLHKDYMTYWQFDIVKGHRSFVGLKVVFVPWMNGLVVLPEL